MSSWTTLQWILVTCIAAWRTWATLLSCDRVRSPGEGMHDLMRIKGSTTRFTPETEPTQWILSPPSRERSLPRRRRSHQRGRQGTSTHSEGKQNHLHGITLEMRRASLHVHLKRSLGSVQEDEQNVRHPNLLWLASPKGLKHLTHKIKCSY